MSDDDQDSASLEFHRGERRRRRRIGLVIAILVLVPMGGFAVLETRARLAQRAALLSEAQRAELTSLLERREAAVQRRVAQWNLAARREALAGLIPGPAACPLTVKPPEQFSAGAYVKYGTHDENFGKWTLCILREGAASDSCARAYQPSAQVLRLRALLAAGEAHTWDLDEARVGLPAEEPGALILVDQEVRPTMQDSAAGRASFVPGALSGRVFFYAPQQGRIVCAGQVSVRNSRSVEVEFNHFGENVGPDQAQAEVRAAVERDLEVVLRFALPAALRQVAEH